ncbi:MAG: class I adenylate-forming enzyme family protein [Pseudomonadota bacterium]
MADAAQSFTDREAAIAHVKATNPLFEVGEAEIRGLTYRVFKNAPPSLRDLFGFAALHGDKDFIVYADERYSFMETVANGNRFAHALIDDLGVKPGDKVGIAMRNYPEWCFAYIGAISMGAVVVPLNAWWGTEEFDYALGDCDANVIVCDARRMEALKPLKEKHGLTLILARETGEGADHRFERLIEGKSVDAPTNPIDPDADFCISYTSGSTGHPKGVVLTHRSALSTIMSWALLAESMKFIDGDMFGDTPGVLMGIPLFHVTASHSHFMLSMVAGRKIVMMYKWDVEEAIELLDKEQLSNFVGVPTQSLELANHIGDRRLPHLIDIGSGGAKRPPEHVERIAKAFPGAHPSSGYGLTETNALGAVIGRAEYRERPDSTGKIVPPLTDIKIVNEGKEMPAGEKGEIWIRSPANFREYLNKPEATADAFAEDGWFRTGDMGRFDEEGYLYVEGRYKDIIIRGGENISALEVENAIYSDENIAEVAVISVPDDVLGEIVGAIVVPKPGCAVDPASVRETALKHLAKFKAPEVVWIAPEQLPRVGTGKIDKLTTRQVALANEPHWKAG